ncbi:MAG: hypothetical protein HY330_01600 [Chloroflexi bacterium]|nr:hypothetical protein [Chloroflexota bacterium]
MPDGSLVENVRALQTALAAVTSLLGAPPEGDQPGSGVAGASALATTTPADRLGAFQGALSTQLASVFNFDSATTVSGLTGLYSSLKTAVQAPPTAPLEGFQGRISQVNEVFSGAFAKRIEQTLASIRKISEGIPQDRSSIVSALLDEILRVLASLEGPEAEKIRSWIQSVEELHRVLMPLIEQARTAPDPAALAVQVVQRSLDSTLDTLGFGPARRLLGFLDQYLGDVLPQEALSQVSNGLTSASTALGRLQAAAQDGYPQFRDAAVAVVRAMDDLKADLRPVLSLVRRVAAAKILQPKALEKFLREQMEKALAVRVEEVQKIDDPFKALLDRIDAAIEGVDLSLVRTEVLGFFQTTRDTLQQVDIPSVADLLKEQLAPVEQAVLALQQSITDLLRQLQAFFHDLAQQLRTLAAGVGTFTPDGTFEFSFERDLRGLFTSARLAIEGDPANPAAPSLAGALDQFQATIVQFLNGLNNLLDPVDQASAGAVTSAVAGINSFAAYLQGLDVPALMEQLRQKVDEIVDALAPIDFDVVVDPVVGQIEENTEKLRAIDTSSLNDLLREALKVALDVIIGIDFTATISAPLKDQFAKVKAVPQQAIQELQERYKQALAMLDDLKPEKLLEALFAGFDVISRAVGSLNVATLLQPLDQLHQRYLQQPLAQLKPSALLKPAADSFQELTSALDGFRGTAVIAPVNTALSGLKGAVAGFNLTGWLDDLLAAVEGVKQDLRGLRPSGLLQPLVEDFSRLESELDRFKPSVVFRPVTELAAPLLQALESVQQQTVEALFNAFAAPLQVLDRLRPEALTQLIQQRIDALSAALNGLNVPTHYNQLKGRYFDLKQAVLAQGDPARQALVEFLDPERQLGDIVAAYSNLSAALQGLKQNVQLPDLAGMYAELRQRLLGMLPPYARELLDPETFKRLMRLADPSRFLQELDQRFDALKNKLIPVRPQDIAAELDSTYEAVLALVDQLDIEDSLNQVKDIFDRVKGAVDGLRVDFLAADIDQGLNDLRAVVAALNPAKFFGDLDAIHQQVEQAVQRTLPSQVLTGLQDPLDRVKGIVARVDPRVTLGPPLNNAWGPLQGALDGVDFTVVLSPVVDKLNELEQAFEASLRRTETAFDQMLGAARTALGGAGASVGVSV